MVKEHILNPMAQRLLPDTKKNPNQESPVNFFTGARRRVSDGDDNSDDVDDADSVMKSFRDLTHLTTEQSTGEVGDGWLPKYKVPLKMFQIVESNKNRKNIVVVSFKFKNRSTKREFIFDTEDQANEFRQIIHENQNLIQTRAKARLDWALRDIQLQKDERLTFLIDICSGSDIPQSDVGRQSDPICHCKFRGETDSSDWVSF